MIYFVGYYVAPVAMYSSVWIRTKTAGSRHRLSHQKYCEAHSEEHVRNIYCKPLC